MHNFFKDFESKLKQFSTQQKKEMIESLLSDDCILVPLSSNKVAIINIEEILFIKQPKYNKIIIQTFNDELEYCNDNCNIFDYVLEKHNGIFKSVNNSVLINVREMKEYDSFCSTIYFLSGHEVAVTQAAIKNIAQKILGKHKDIYVDPLEVNKRFKFFDVKRMQ